MKILRFAPLLGTAGAAGLGAACLVVWTLQWHPPAPKPALSEADLARFARAALSEPAPKPVVSLKSPSSAGVEPASPPASSAEAATGDKDVTVRLAYANPEGAAPTLGAPSKLAPAAPTVSEPSAPVPGPGLSAPAADPALPPPAVSQAVILYGKGDVAGLSALAASATGPV